MNIRGMEWIIILAVILLLFGPKQLPNLARSIGKTITEFRTGVKGVEQDLRNLAKETEPNADSPPPPDKDETKKELEKKPENAASQDEPEPVTPKPDYPEDA